MKTATTWKDVKTRIKDHSIEDILKAAEFHIKGLEWIIENVLSEDVLWPDKVVQDIIMYAVLDTTKVKFEDHISVLKHISDGGQMEFRGLIIPIKQSIRASNYLLENHDWLMDQYDVIQKVLEHARKEQGGANWESPDQYDQWTKRT